jgi:hypothetical protein
MENYIKTATKLYVAVNVNGGIVNSNDSKDLGPAFAMTDTKVRIENGEVVENYALHIDYDFNKQGAFSILGCSKITAAMIARRYCENNHISPVKKSWLYCDNYENVYQVVDIDNVEYNFHISRAYYEDGKQREFFGAYVSIKKGNDIKIMEITNINDL